MSYSACLARGDTRPTSLAQRPRHTPYADARDAWCRARVSRAGWQRGEGPLGEDGVGWRGGACPTPLAWRVGTRALHRLRSARGTRPTPMRGMLGVGRVSHAPGGNGARARWARTEWGGGGAHVLLRLPGAWGHAPYIACAAREAHALRRCAGCLV